MEWKNQLTAARFVRRYKRFFADIETAGGPLTVHVPNTGSLKTCLFEHSDCVYLPSDNPARKLKGTLMFLKTPTSWVGVNTAIPNQLVHELWASRTFAPWTAYGSTKPEVKISKDSRIDLVLAPSEAELAHPQKCHFIEVKNVTLAENGRALFPDAVTTRGQKHLRELMRLKDEGATSEITFVIQRTDCRSFAPAEAIDPEYARLLREANKKGVRVNAFVCEISPLEGIRLSPNPLPIEL